MTGQARLVLAPLESYVRATLDKKDAERRQDEYRADAMGEARTITEAGKKAVALEHEVLIIRGSEVLDVHATLKAIAKAIGIPDERGDQTATELLLEDLVTKAGTTLRFAKRPDSLRVL